MYTPDGHAPMFMTSGLAGFLIAGNFLIGAILGIAIAKIRSARFTLAVALRAAFFGGITFLFSSVLAGWMYEHAHYVR